MPTIANGRRHLSELIKAKAKFDNEGFVNYNYASVPVEGSSDVDPIGTPLVWVDANSAFEVYVAQDIAAVVNSPLPDGSPICLSVGAKEGVGFNKTAITLSATAETMTAIFRGPAGYSEEGMDWGGAGAPAQAAFKLQLEKQGVASVATAAIADPSFTV